MEKYRFSLRITVTLLTLLPITSIAQSTARKAREGHQSAPPNTLSQKETKQGFTLLFDGNSLDNFKGAEKATIPEGCWLVNDGQIICTSRDSRPEGARGSIVTKKQYSNFDFRLEYKMDSDYQGNVNSGIKYFAYPGTELGLEYQLYDHDKDINGPHNLADLYDLLPAKGRPAKPRGHWNTVRIVAQGNIVQHWLNNRKVLEFTRGSERFRAAVAKSKFRNRERFGEAEQGHILLQEHGGGIAFRNLRITVLNP